MKKIIDINNLDLLRNEKVSGKKIVLLGGCFDVLHAGHLEFLKKSKSLGDILVILLESDEKIRQTKGNYRPINNQDKRANVLGNIGVVDYVIKLPFFEFDSEYEKLVIQIEPDIIALTSGTHVFEWEKEFIRKSGGKIIEVMEKKKNHSTTNLINGL